VNKKLKKKNKFGQRTYKERNKKITRNEKSKNKKGKKLEIVKVKQEVFKKKFDEIGR
jgi:hypothetical protein